MSTILKAIKLNYSEIKIGDKYCFDAKFTAEDINTFARLSGDFNPLHVNPNYGKMTRFKDNIVHGMLSASLFSRLVGMYCPGQLSVYMWQTLNFKQPIYINDILKVCGLVTNKNDSIKLITLKTTIYRDEQIMVDGEAKVRVAEDKDD